MIGWEEFSAAYSLMHRRMSTMVALAWVGWPAWMVDVYCETME